MTEQSDNSTPCSGSQPFADYNSSSFHINGMSFNYTDVFSTVKQPPHMVVLFIVAYSIIFMAALIGNTMVVAVVMLRPGMRSVTNLFIANLAVADMLVAVLCIPITLMDNIYYGWPFGEILCKLTPYIQGVSVCASVYNLAAIAVDRYLAICFKPQFRIMRRGACLSLIGIWALSFALMVPWFVYYKHFTPVTQTLEYCQPMFPSFQASRVYYVVAIFLGTYIMPLIVVLLCYILIARRVWQRRAPGVATSCNVIKRYRIKVIKMLVTVVAVFALSWLPLHTLYMSIYFVFPRDEHIKSQITNVGLPLAQWLELSNSGMNAIIYCFFSENFRRGFMDLFRCVLRRRRINFNRASSSQVPARRVGRSLSEESTMGSCVVQRPQCSSRWKETQKFLQMSALEKRYVWKNGRGSCAANGPSTTVKQDIEERPNSARHKWPRVMELTPSHSLNEQDHKIIEMDTCCDDNCYCTVVG